MFKRTLTFVAIMALGAVGFAQGGAVRQAGSAAQATAAKPDATKSKALLAVQGTWVFTSANGQDTAGQPEIMLTLTDNKYVQTAGGQVVETGTFKIDETKKPFALEITVVEGQDAGKTQFGIYELSADGMTMKCKVNDAGGTTKPTDFTLAEGSFVFTASKKK